MKKKLFLGSVLLFAVAFAFGAKKLAPFVYPADCVGCNDCVKICPVKDGKALSMHNGKAVVDPEFCISCGACVYVCGFNAVRW